MATSDVPPTPSVEPVDPPPLSASPTSAQLKGDIDGGPTGDKDAILDPAMAPLGTDDEAAGTPPSGDDDPLPVSVRFVAGGFEAGDHTLLAPLPTHSSRCGQDDDLRATWSAVVKVDYVVIDHPNTAG